MYKFLINYNYYFYLYKYLLILVNKCNFNIKKTFKKLFDIIYVMSNFSNKIIDFLNIIINRLKINKLKSIKLLIRLTYKFYIQDLNILLKIHN
jgi:hypothetical protein